MLVYKVTGIYVEDGSKFFIDHTINEAYVVNDILAHRDRGGIDRTTGIPYDLDIEIVDITELPDRYVRIDGNHAGYQFAKRSMGFRHVFRKVRNIRYGYEISHLTGRVLLGEVIWHGRVLSVMTKWDLHFSWHTIPVHLSIRLEHLHPEDTSLLNYGSDSAIVQWAD